MAYIYKIINDINEKVYIGKTQQTIQQRWSNHLKDSVKTTKEHRPLYAAMRKYGGEHFKIEIIEECDTFILEEREIYWINYYDSYRNGYNATLGGDGTIRLNHQQIIDLYKQEQNMIKVAEIIGCSKDSVSDILKANNIETLTSQEVTHLQHKKQIQMIDKKTLELVNEFETHADAARYLIDNNLTNCKFTTIRYHISEVCRGIRKSAAGFIWKEITD